MAREEELPGVPEQKSKRLDRVKQIFNTSEFEVTYRTSPTNLPSKIMVHQQKGAISLNYLSLPFEEIFGYQVVLFLSHINQRGSGDVGGCREVASWHAFGRTIALGIDQNEQSAAQLLVANLHLRC